MFSIFSGAIYSQQGVDIGARMSFALAQALRSFDTAVLIGCDCMDFSADYLDEAFTALEQNSDVVFGPAMDGGYVLIGQRTHNDEIFQNIEWGSARVMQQSRLRAQENNLRWQELEALHDIDEPGDLIYLKGSKWMQAE